MAQSHGAIIHDTLTLELKGSTFVFLYIKRTNLRHWHQTFVTHSWNLTVQGKVLILTENHITVMAKSTLATLIQRFVFSALCFIQHRMFSLLSEQRGIIWYTFSRCGACARSD